MKAIVVECEYDDLWSTKFDSEEAAREYVASTDNKCYLILVRVEPEHAHLVSVAVEPHT